MTRILVVLVAVVAVGCGKRSGAEADPMGGVQCSADERPICAWGTDEQPCPSGAACGTFCPGGTTCRNGAMEDVFASTGENPIECVSGIAVCADEGSPVCGVARCVDGAVEISGE